MAIAENLILDYKLGMPKSPREASRILIQSFEAKALKKRSFGVRFADELTSFFGSAWFLLLNIVLFAFWIAANTGRIPGVAVFDPYPFVLMITAVSLEAIVLTTVVLMSQNRQSLISSLREEIDMQVNLISEREITKALKLLNELLEARGIKLKDSELEEMLKEIDTSYIERRLSEQLTEKQPSIVQEVTKEVTKPILAATEKAAEGVEKTILK